MIRTAGRPVLLVLGLALWGAPAQASHCDAPPPYDELGHLPEEMLDWATEIEEIERGPKDIADPLGGDASFGVAENALGPATGDVFDVVSLGDGGHVTLWFASGIGDGPGDDFAVFENGFFSPTGGFFAELAFVEVSSNGVDFARFASAAWQEEPVPDGGVVDWTDYCDLAGRHPAGEGTGFDLAELAGHPLVAGGLLDLAEVTTVRIVDVIGDGSTLDHRGEPVYDPYPTSHPSGGHDLEAVGVLHVPEPGSAAMSAAGALLVAALARRRGARSCAP